MKGVLAFLRPNDVLVVDRDLRFGRVPGEPHVGCSGQAHTRVCTTDRQYPSMLSGNVVLWHFSGTVCRNTVAVVTATWNHSVTGGPAAVSRPAQARNG